MLTVLILFNNGLNTIIFNLLVLIGQSFGAFLAPGVTLELEGDANDYIGKVCITC